MLNSSKLRGVLALGVVASLAFVPSAVAVGGAVTLGPADPLRAGEIAQQLNYTTPPVFVTSKAPSGVSITAPADGVITSWTVYTREVTTVGATARLRILTLNGPLEANSGGSFTITNSGPSGSIPPVTPAAGTNAKHTFTNLHVPIRAGQFPGFSVDRGPEGYFVVRLPVDTDYGYAQLSQDGGFADGQTRTLFGVNEQFVSYNARFERDNDRDRFGDSTQDKCVAFAGVYSGCATKMTSNKTVVKRGKKVRLAVLGAKAGTKYTIKLGNGRFLAKGKVPKSGKVVRFVKIPKRVAAKKYAVVFKTARPKDRTTVPLTVKR